jgi:hypothetical protein
MQNDQAQWFVQQAGKQHGPMSLDEMENLIQQGYLRRDNFVWRPGLQDWVPAAQIPELFPTPPPPPIAPPPFHLREQTELSPDGASRASTAPISRKHTPAGVTQGRAEQLVNIAPVTKWLKGLLIGFIFVCAASLVSNLAQYELIRDIRSGAYGSAAAINAAAVRNDSRQQLIAAIYTATILATIIVFCIWIYRSNKVARQLGAADMKFTPGWAVGWYFIPFANLWMPYKAMKEIWAATKNPADWKNERRGAILPWWWFLFILSNTLSNVYIRMSLSAEGADQITRATEMGMASEIALIASTIVAYKVVSEISGLQFSRSSQSVPTTLGS